MSIQKKGGEKTWYPEQNVVSLFLNRRTDQKEKSWFEFTAEFNAAWSLCPAAWWDVRKRFMLLHLVAISRPSGEITETWHYVKQKLWGIVFLLYFMGDLSPIGNTFLPLSTPIRLFSELENFQVHLGDILFTCMCMLCLPTEFLYFVQLV